MTLEFETSLGCAAIGVDEAGRGPLAGPVFAAAVQVPLERARALLEGEWSEVDDSKRLSAAKRERLALAIKSESVWCVASASAAEIDELNILRATHLAMRRAVEGVLPRISGEAVALVDGLPVKGLPCRSVNVVKGDSKSLLIAAASILAKTARDADCIRLEAAYPGYGFARHKGYPVKAHIEALRRLGPCPEHRMSFAPVRACQGQVVRSRPHLG